MTTPTSLPGVPDAGSAIPPRDTFSATSHGRIRPLIVPLDGSAIAERALPYAEILAGPGCQGVLLEVRQDEEEFRLLDRHVDPCAQLKTVTGDPAEQIQQVATQLGVGLIVMTRPRPSGAWKVAFGSVADTVSRTTPVPVMIIRPWQEGAPPDPIVRRIVAPLDGAPLSTHAPPNAKSLAQQLHVPVHLLTAIDVSQLLPAGLTPTVAFNAEVYRDAIPQAQRDAEGWLAQAAAQLHGNGVEITQEVRTGASFAVIQEIVQPRDIIVLVSRGRHGAARLVLVSLAAQLIREGSTPVALAPTGDQAGEQSPYHAVPGSPDAWWARIHQTDRSEPCRV